MTVDINRVQTLKNLPSVNQAINTNSKSYDSTIRLISSKGYFFCTGAVIDENYAITAAHCVVDDSGIMTKDNIMIYNSFGFSTETVATAAAVEMYRDVAFIKGDFSRFTAHRADFHGDHVKTGMKLKACGYPSGQLQLYCVDLVQTGNRWFQYRAVGGPFFKGMSGGPVYNEENIIVGVNSAVDNDTVIVSPLIGVLELVGL